MATITLHGNSVSAKALAIGTISTDTATNGTAVDTALYSNNFRDVKFVVLSGAITDGSYAVTVEESDSSGSGYGGGRYRTGVGVAADIHWL